MLLVSALSHAGMHLVVTLGWDILPVSDQGCSKTSTLLLEGNGDGKSAVPYFLCLLSSLSAVLTHDLSSGRHSNSPAMSTLTSLHLRSRATPLAWSHTHPAPAEQPGAHGIASAAQGGCSQNGTGHVFQGAEHARKPRQGQWKGAGNPGMPFLKQPFFQEAGRVCSHCPGMGPGVARPAICSNLLECYT